ncbi:MAG TPA: hypothetical protein VG711_08385 [Phycisphaerales bacterium]|nr:hypothetical protein [Phycisphaerales bacterium]
MVVTSSTLSHITSAQASPPIPPAHFALIEALNSARPDPAIERIFANDGVRIPPHVLLPVLKSLVAIRVPGVAIRLLRTHNALVQQTPELRELHQILASLPSGEIPRATLESNFRTNIENLLASNPHLQQIANAITVIPPDISIFKSVTGNYFITTGHAESPLDLKLPFADHASVANSFSLPANVEYPAFRAIGLPPPQLFTKILNSSTPAGYLPPIDILEPDIRLLPIWLSMFSDSDFFASSRVQVFAGADALAAYRDRLILNHAQPLPTISLTTPRPDLTPAIIQSLSLSSDQIREISLARNAKVKSALDALTSHYHAMSESDWASRFSASTDGARKLTVVGLTSRYSTVMQHAMRDLGSALTRTGCTFHTEVQQAPWQCAVDISSVLSRCKPDLIITINHLRSELTQYVPPAVPCISWLQDYMKDLWTSTAGKSVTSRDLILTRQAGELITSYAYPSQRIIETSNLTDPYTYSADPLPESERAPFRCDLCYVGHGSETPEQLIESALGTGNSSSLRSYLTTLLHFIRSAIEYKSSLSFFDILDLIILAERRSSHPPLTPALRRQAIHPIAVRLYDRVLRHQTLDWAAQWASKNNRTFRIYGRGWNHHPKFSQWAAGEVVNGRSLRALAQAASIQLHVTAWQSLHQRLLDGFASGGFILTRHNPSDFHRADFAAVQQYVVRNEVNSLADLAACRTAHPELDAALERLESGEFISVEMPDSPQRKRQMRLMAEVFNSPGVADDKSVLSTLRTMPFVPPRVAGDLPQFESTTFDSMTSLGAQLDRFVDDAPGRARLAQPIRQSIIQNDTHDGLVKKILEYWRQVFSK